MWKGTPSGYRRLLDGDCLILDRLSYYLGPVYRRLVNAAHTLVC